MRAAAVVFLCAAILPAGFFLMGMFTALTGEQDWGPLGIALVAALVLGGVSFALDMAARRLAEAAGDYPPPRTTSLAPDLTPGNLRGALLRDRGFLGGEQLAK